MSCVEEKVVRVLQELGVPEISDLSASLAEDLALDSLQLVLLLLKIEEVFEIELDESDMNPFTLKVVSDVVSMVKKYLPEQEDHDNG